MRLCTIDTIFERLAQLNCMNVHHSGIWRRDVFNASQQKQSYINEKNIRCSKRVGVLYNFVSQESTGNETALDYHRMQTTGWSRATINCRFHASSLGAHSSKPPLAPNGRQPKQAHLIAMLKRWSLCQLKLPTFGAARY